MAGKRIDLHYKLINVLGSDKVFFSPPSTVKLSYPCIIYHRNKQQEFYANNNFYFGKKAYLITIIDPNPDSKIPDRMMSFRYCSFVNHYVADNLNHDVYLLYF